MFEAPLIAVWSSQPQGTSISRLSDFNMHTHHNNFIEKHRVSCGHSTHTLKEVELVFSKVSLLSYLLAILHTGIRKY